MDVCLISMQNYYKFYCGTSKPTLDQVRMELTSWVPSKLS